MYINLYLLNCARNVTKKIRMIIKIGCGDLKLANCFVIVQTYL